MNRCCIVCFQIQNCFAAGNSVVVVFVVIVLVGIGIVLVPEGLSRVAPLKLNGNWLGN
jgi:hypothetical protein